VRADDGGVDLIFGRGVTTGAGVPRVSSNSLPKLNASKDEKMHNNFSVTAGRVILNMLFVC